MLFLAFLIILIIVLGGGFLAWENSASLKGIRGESRVSSILSQLSEEYTTLNDLVFRTEKGTTQIDHIVISKYGVFVIETKNYRGEIYGDDNRQEWTQIIATDVTFTRKWWKTYTYVTKNQFYNPVKQSKGHSFKIKELLQNLYPYLKIIPIVVFVGDAVLKNVTSKSHVIYEKDLISTINNYKVIYLNDKDVQVVHDILTRNNVRELVNNRQHVKNLQDAEKEVKDTIESGICPKCGGQLIKHNGKYGTFYGCSNYPKCKFSTK